MASTEILTPGLIKIATQEAVVDATKAKVDNSLDLLRHMSGVEETDEDVEAWQRLRSGRRPKQYEAAFRRSDTGQAAALLLADDLLRNKKLDIATIEALLAEVEDVVPGRTKKKPAPGTEEYVKDRAARVIALLNLGFEGLRGSQIGGMAGAAGGSPGGQESAMFNTPEYARLIKQITKAQLLKAEGMGPDEVGELTFEQARLRAAASFISMYIGRDRGDMQFVYEMKLGDWTFAQLLGDWIRELPDAEDRFGKAWQALSSMMSVDGKRSEEIMRSGIKDTDFTRLLSYRYPLKIYYAESPNDSADKEKRWKELSLEASVWDVVNYQFGIKRVERDPKKRVVLESDGGNHRLRVEDRVVGADGKDIPAAPLTPGAIVKELGQPRKYKVAAPFTSSSGKVYGRGDSIYFEELSNEDHRRLNRGVGAIYPELHGYEMFSTQPTTPGNALVAERGDMIDRNSSWAYFTDLLARHGITVDQVRDFDNPWADIGVEMGIASEFGADWLTDLKGFDDREDKGKLLVVRNMAVGLGALHAAGVMVAKAIGHEHLWFPNYDEARNTRAIEQTLQAHIYNEKKGISNFSMRLQLMQPLYPTFEGRLARKRHPVVLSWQGTSVDMLDRADPWEVLPPNSLEVAIKPIEYGTRRETKKNEEIKLETMKRRAGYGVALDGVSTENNQRIIAEQKSRVDAVRAEWDGAREVDEYLFMERTLKPGDWEEMKVLNNIYHSALSLAARGVSAESVLAQMTAKLDGFIQNSLRHPDSVRTDVMTVRNTPQIVAAAVGALPTEKQAIAERSVFGLMEGLALSNEEKDLLTGLQRAVPDAFMGVNGTMLYASESFGLEQFDYANTLREIEAWYRYLMSNGDVVKLSTQIFRDVIQVAIDPVKAKSLSKKLFSPDSAAEGFQHEMAEGLVEWWEIITKLPKLMNDAEAGDLLKGIGEDAVAWTDRHADMNWEQRRSLYMSLVYILDGWIDSGLEHVLLSQENDLASKPGDHHIPLALDPEDKSYSTNEQAVVKGLIELFTSRGWRIDFNVARKTKGILLLQGGMPAFSMMGRMTNDGLWKSVNLHDELVGAIKDMRPVDQYGMGYLAKKIIGYYLCKVGLDAGIITVDDWDAYARDAADFDHALAGRSRTRRGQI
jgi:hypothetical protein